MPKGRKRSTRPREPSGRIQRPTTRVERDAEVRSTAEEARQRVHGLSKADAAKQEAGTAIGRALIAGDIDRPQFEAAMLYEQVVRSYQAAILAKRPGSAGDLDRYGGHDGAEGDEPAYVENCAKARRLYGDCRRALLDADPLAQMAVHAWVLENHQATGLIGEMRLGLNALGRVFRVEEWSRSSRAA